MRRTRLTDAENRVRQATWAFADGRLENAPILEWALGLTTDQEAERASLRDLFDRQAKSVGEPFALAWRCIFEYWQRPDAETNHGKFLIRRELKQGGTQREVIRLIVDSVRPWLKIDTSKRYRALSGEELPKKPKHLKHLIWASISSGDRLTPQDIGLQEINDRDFLFELATGLNAALLSGLNLARMIGSISKDMDVTNWQVHRVYYVPAAQYPEGGGEPDRHSDGFAPATKLMFAVTERLASIDVEAARRIVASWDTNGWKLYRRLWAAAARNSELVDAEDVSAFLGRIDDAEFWWASSYPEIAEVRAVRWSSFSADSAARLERRLLKGEPAKLIPDGIEKVEVARYKRRHILIELRRIQAAEGNLSERAVNWLEEAAKELEHAPGVDVTHGFNQGVRLLHRERTAVQSFEGIANSKLLDTLAKSLADSGWDDKSQNASEFIAQNASVVLELLEKFPDLTVAAKIWQAFGYGFRPSDLNVGPDKASAEDRAKIPVAVQACKALTVERPEVISKAISGLTSFMGSWDRLLSDQDEFRTAWLALWPFAIAKINELEEPSSPLSDRAYNSPVGQLLLALISTCPRLQAGEDPMSQGLWPQLLSAVAETTGEARLEAQYVLIRDLGYFIVAAPAWASKNLLEPLKASTHGSATLALWEGFGSGHLPQREVMSELAQSIVTATISNELSGKVKGDLAERVMWSILLDREEGKEPAVPIYLAQQMLRMGGDDVRKESVRALEQFLKRDNDLDEQARFELVRSVFQEVWPKELTLSSKAVSETLAELPAAAGAYYAEAAELVLPYLTPFDCWSLWDYGVLDHNDPDEKLKSIDDPVKASAFLSVLDKTVGGEDGAIIPDGLEDGLLHIARLAPKLNRDVRFQRLLTLSRR
ncbi:hypothetical protein [Sinorhizobium meliloti]|uniref:hypothetical protein n=1 Tax=Rhizobium meliloti TaxID=382 RepID=UPI000FDA16B2|nr:hypothetical protein [Sinorhizobium meliloti]RVG14949.1 hypothetical protein CN231_17670 [Sinorhizobium meliloti]